MTYGSPKNAAEVPAYLINVYGGKEPKPDVIKEFRRRYKLIGGSPLISITQDQAKALEKELNKQLTLSDYTFLAEGGMRFSHPYIAEAVAELAAKGVGQLIGIIMSPQYSPIIMSGYIKELKEAVSKQNPALSVYIATDWHMQPFFIKALAERVTQALEHFPKNTPSDIPVLFSAHSMPKRVIEKEPGYIEDLQETAAAVAKAAGLTEDRWLFCYQSAGHTPEEWLKPDFADIMPELQKKGNKHVLIAPVQFLADHLEILYDVGIAAREQAELFGINFARTESLNTSKLFIKALAAVVQKTARLH